MNGDNEFRVAIQKLKDYRLWLTTRTAQVDSAIRILGELTGEPVSEGADKPEELAPANRNPAIAATLDSGNSTTTFHPGALFGLSQREAAVEVLRRYNRPLTMIEILEILQREKFAFETQNPYQSLFKAMTRSKDFVKHGKQWGLNSKDWPSRRVGVLFQEILTGDLENTLKKLTPRDDGNDDNDGESG